MANIFSRPKTYFIDIDGTLLEHHKDFQDTLNTDCLPNLPYAREKTGQWHCEGHTIVITTARCESMRPLTIRQLENAGIVYDHLLMGITSGVRVLINDYVPGEGFTAECKNVIRNKEGLRDVP